MRWKQFRYRLEWLGVKALVVVIPLLPRRVCVALSRVVGAVAFVIDRKGRAVTLSNIEAAFGSRYTPAERIRIGRASYQNFARTMLDLFWAPALIRSGGKKYVDLVGGENLSEHRDKPAVVLVAHLGNFEWTGVACGMHDLHGCVLTQAFKNPLLDSFFTSLRSSTGQEIITRHFSMLRMLRRVLKGGFVGMLVDLNVPPSQAATVIDTFGMKMCATLLYALLARRSGARLVPMTGEPLPDGRCRVQIHPALEIPTGATERQICQIAWNFFEERIRAKPELWMWVYKHWRYRPKDDPHPYPFYARESGRFEKRAKEVAAIESAIGR